MKKSQRIPIIIPLISQLAKAGISVRVPVYRKKADDAESKKFLVIGFYLGHPPAGG